MVNHAPLLTDVDNRCTSFLPPSFTFRGLPLQHQMNLSSPAAPSLWSSTHWSSPPPPCRGCSPSGPRPKGKASTPLPHRPPTPPTSRAAKPTTRSQRASCSWPRARAKMERRRRRRRAKEGAHRQVKKDEQEKVDGFTFSLIIQSVSRLEL